MKLNKNLILIVIFILIVLLIVKKKQESFLNNKSVIRVKDSEGYFNYNIPYVKIMD